MGGVDADHRARTVLVQEAAEVAFEAFLADGETQVLGDGLYLDGRVGHVGRGENSFRLSDAGRLAGPTLSWDVTELEDALASRTPSASGRARCASDSHNT